MVDQGKEVKVVLLGDVHVGKSSIVTRFSTNSFDKYVESTIGAAFVSKMIMANNTPVKFQIWDTAGQEKYQSLAPMYYRGAAAAILVYDITEAKTFARLQEWVVELQRQGPENLAIAIAGNKCDLESARAVPTDEAERYARSIGAFFIETSAKADIGVHAIFQELSKRIPQTAADDGMSDATLHLSDGGSTGGGGGKSEKKKCC